LYKTLFITNFVENIYEFYNFVENNFSRKNYLIIKIFSKNSRKKSFLVNFLNKFAKKITCNVRIFSKNSRKKSFLVNFLNKFARKITCNVRIFSGKLLYLLNFYEFHVIFNFIYKYHFH